MQSVYQLESTILEQWRILTDMQSVEDLTRDIENLTCQEQEKAPQEDQSDEVRAQEAKVYALVNSFPAAGNGNKYIGSRCSICPRLVVEMRDMRPVLEPQCEGNLLLIEVAKALKNQDGKLLEIQPKYNEIIGTFPKEPRCLKLTNIRLAGGATLKPNEWTVERVREECLRMNKVSIGGNIDFGPYKTDPRLQYCKFLADVEFGEFIVKDHKITAQTTGSDASIKWIIPIARLAGKIESDGSVTLKENGATFNMEQLDVACPEVWIEQSHEHTIDVKVRVEAGEDF